MSMKLSLLCSQVLLQDLRIDVVAPDLFQPNVPVPDVLSLGAREVSCTATFGSWL